jgi:hypothetical protein
MLKILRVIPRYVCLELLGICNLYLRAITLLYGLSPKQIALKDGRVKMQDRLHFRRRYRPQVVKTLIFHEFSQIHWPSDTALNLYNVSILATVGCEKLLRGFGL